jgi:hypothetical protein
MQACRVTPQKTIAEGAAEVSDDVGQKISQKRLFTVT